MKNSYFFSIRKNDSYQKSNTNDLLRNTIANTWKSIIITGSGVRGYKQMQSLSFQREKGAQYKIWKETKHAKAFDALLTEKARKIWIEKGLKSSPDKAPECLECHTVVFGAGGYEVMDEKFWSPADDDRAGKKAAKRMENLKNVRL